MKPKVVPAPEPLVAVVEQCNSCRFYRLPKKMPSGQVVFERPGACRRYPEPVLKETTDWCGEWEMAR